MVCVAEKSNNLNGMDITLSIREIILLYSLLRSSSNCLNVYMLYK